jgi:hypothetical protein
MNLNDDVVYRCRRLGPLHQRHPGRSRSLVRYHDCFHPAPPGVEFSPERPGLRESGQYLGAAPWAQRIVERQRAQNFEGGCRLGSLAAELVESDAELQADFAAGFERWEALLLVRSETGG